MEIRVTTLRQALDLLKPVVPSKTKLPVLSNVCVSSGRINATDLESLISVDLPESAGESFSFPFRTVNDTIKYVPGSAYLKTEIKDDKLHISWPEGSATFPAGKAEDYPMVPELTETGRGEIDGDTLVPTLESALTYCATEDTRPVIAGVTLVLGRPVEVAAGDGFRMAHTVLSLEFPVEQTAVLPARSVSLLSHLLKHTPRTPSQSECLVTTITSRRQLGLTLYDGYIKFEFGNNAYIMVKPIQGTPPDWFKLLPKEENITMKASLFGRELETAVRRVSSIAAMGKGTVRLEFIDSKVRVSAEYEGNEVEASVNLLSVEGGPNKVAMNFRYLVDYLSGKETIVTIGLVDRSTPVSFQYRNTPRVIIMPMFVQWDDEKVPDSESEAEPGPEDGETPAEEPAAETHEKPQGKKRRKKE